VRTRVLIVGLVFAACSTGSYLRAEKLPDATQTVENRPKVKVSVQCEGRIPLDVMEVGEVMVRQLFSRIGITIVFISRQRQMDSGTIVLELWDYAPRNLDRYTMGRATVGDHGRLAHVYLDRVTQFAGSSDPRKTGSILGYVMAHEMGHLLRDEPTHEPAGIMKAHWTSMDAVEMFVGVVAFTSADVERIFRVMGTKSPVSVRAAGE
jgi:hypothetical protein